jgi:hypothetical protein
MIYLVGVDHRVQWIRDPRIRSSVPRLPSETETRRKLDYIYFISVACKAISELRIEVLAEEMNRQILDERYNHANSVLELLKETLMNCVGLEIEHVFVEPLKEEKQRKGYREIEDVSKLLGVDQNDIVAHAHMAAHQFPVREGLWLEKIKCNLHKPILFVCGEAHIDTFSMMLHREKIDYKEIARKIGVQGTSPDLQGVSLAQKMDLFETSSCPCKADSF